MACAKKFQGEYHGDEEADFEPPVVVFERGGVTVLAVEAES